MFVKTKIVKRPRFNRERYDEMYQDFENQLGSREFDGCCGVHELYGFENLGVNHYSQEEKNYLAYYLNNDFHEWGDIALCVATLNKQQIKSTEPILLKAGFKKGLTGRNDAYQGAAITLYTKIITPVRKR